MTKSGEAGRQPGELDPVDQLLTSVRAFVDNPPPGFVMAHTPTMLDESFILHSDAKIPGYSQQPLYELQVPETPDSFLEGSRRAIIKLPSIRPDGANAINAQNAAQDLYEVYFEGSVIRRLLIFPSQARLDTVQAEIVGMVPADLPSLGVTIARAIGRDILAYQISLSGEQVGDAHKMDADEIVDLNQRIIELAQLYVAGEQP
jgi:hypothetical protein